MKRTSFFLFRLILYPTPIHVLCGAVALLSCVPILFPEVCPEGASQVCISYAGGVLLIAAAISTVCMALAVCIHMFRLNNLRAFSQMFKWAGAWACGILGYFILTIAADVQPPTLQDSNHSSDILHTPHEQLNGPASLVIPIMPDGVNIEKVADTPNLIALENEHDELLMSYLKASPRWSGQEGDDTFYTKPGHLVMVPPTAAGIPSLVHVCFRRLVEGDPLPQGFTVVKPGGDFPDIGTDNPQIPDIALDLGRNHFLLLAWRGSTHKETAWKAINAAIAATDARMQPLRETPTQETVTKMLAGRESYPGNTPDFKLSEPLAQDGAYQAELYANPGESGVILVYIKDLATGQTLRLLNCEARFSENENELFRHDIPGSMPHWIRSTGDENIANIFPRNTPLFAIRLGPQRQYFGVAFEIWFKPTDVRRNRRLIIRRCYKVQAYDPPGKPR